MTPGIPTNEIVGTPGISVSTPQATPSSIQLQGQADDLLAVLKAAYRLIRKGEKSPSLMECTHTGTPSGCREFMVVGCAAQGKIVLGSNT